MLLLAGFAGCAAPKPPELDYLPPSGQPAAERSAFVRQRPWLVWGNILDHLQQQGVQVSIVNEAGGELVVFYNGDPQPYVDCGWIVTYRGAELDRVPAAASDASFLRRRDGEVVTLERELKLDARMRVDVEPSGDDTIVRTDSTYMLTKTISSPQARQPFHAETIDFHTGESEAFSSGTACQPTGELERLVFDGLPTVSLAAISCSCCPEHVRETHKPVLTDVGSLLAADTVTGVSDRLCSRWQSQRLEERIHPYPATSIA